MEKKFELVHIYLVEFYKTNAKQSDFFKSYILLSLSIVSKKSRNIIIPHNNEIIRIWSKNPMKKKCIYTRVQIT